ncbi:hypothetical protein E4U36_002831 [Claviceps purpurea]|nr:hypothetical protein E4U36_002831 [Claviceps purpurea]
MLEELSADDAVVIDEYEIISVSLPFEPNSSAGTKRPAHFQSTSTIHGKPSEITNLNQKSSIDGAWTRLN